MNKPLIAVGLCAMVCGGVMLASLIQDYKEEAKKLKEIRKCKDRLNNMMDVFNGKVIYLSKEDYEVL